MYRGPPPIPLAIRGVIDVRRSRRRSPYRASRAHRSERSGDAASATRDQRHSQVRRGSRSGRRRGRRADDLRHSDAPADARRHRHRRRDRRSGAGQRAFDRGRLFPRPQSDRMTGRGDGDFLQDPDLTDLTSLTLAEARDRLKSRAISSIEITRVHLEAMERAKALNAYIATTADRALQMAEASDARLAKGEGGLLEGLPIGVKDLYATKGVHTQACSHILDGFRPPYESTVTANLWREGAVMLGKLNMDEFAMGSSNETSYYGPVASPWLPPN